MTGPGRTRLSFASSGFQGVYDLESFWFAVKKKAFRYDGRIAVVGAGENAASILLAFAKAAPELRVDVISPKGFVSTRSENFYENQIYSQPERNGWAELSLSDRLEFISRTDLGVFSVHAMQILNDEIRHRVIPGKAVALSSQGNALTLAVEYHGQKTSHDYDQVILATGFDHSSVLRSLFSPSTLQEIENELDAPLNDQGLTPRMRTDLSVEGINPPLHLPMLAGVMQGPGFSNLSCLGSLSDRILLGDMAL
jgi:mycobactin lysine-N-oxygenase